MGSVAGRMLLAVRHRPGDCPTRPSERTDRTAHGRSAQGVLIGGRIGGPGRGQFDRLSAMGMIARVARSGSR